MQTNLIPLYQERPEGVVAEKILRSCVHCGFCNATCPSYQVLGNELDGPRGRIYLIKQMLEGGEVSEKTRLHLDRCLTCQSCESTCPSGVDYHRLLNVGRQLLEEKLPRRGLPRFKRKALAWFLTSPRLFGLLLSLGRIFQPILPSALKSAIPSRADVKIGPLDRTVGAGLSPRVVFLHEGCVQDAISPEINLATRAVFSALSIDVQTLAGGCCGAIEFHLDEQAVARSRMRENIDRWHALISQQPSAFIVSNASGCGAFLKDYASILADDADYLIKASELVKRVKDPVELIDGDELAALLSSTALVKSGHKVAYQSPCSLQHGQKLSGAVEGLLTQAGVDISVLRDAHLCCGSAGTYSILQSEISQELKQRKLASIGEVSARHVVTANIGCQTHLNSGTELGVKHWLVLIAEMITMARSET